MAFAPEALPLFHEVQRFRAWLQFAVLVPAFVVVPLFGWGLYEQLVLGKPFGNHPMDDQELIVASVIATAVTLGIALLFYVAQLETTVHRDRVVVRFRPFHLSGRAFAFEEIAEAEARTYRPLIEYGGWGIRYGLSGLAYSVSGHRGVQLTMHDGRRILIGSQRADALAAVIAPAIPGAAL